MSEKHTLKNQWLEKFGKYIYFANKINWKVRFYTYLFI